MWIVEQEEEEEEEEQEEQEAVEQEYQGEQVAVAVCCDLSRRLAACRSAAAVAQSRGLEPPFPWTQQQQRNK